MSYAINDEQYPPTFSLTFTSFAGGLVLDGANAPADFRHLPCQLVVQVAVAAQHLDYTDNAGVAQVMTFPAVGTFVIRMAPVSIQATTTVAGLTVFWSAKASAFI